MIVEVAKHLIGSHAYRAFHIVKAFLELATRNTVEELQAYTNTYVPPPYWAEVVAATIPLSCCNRAADALISWFDPEELKRLVGVCHSRQ